MNDVIDAVTTLTWRRIRTARKAASGHSTISSTTANSNASSSSPVEPPGTLCRWAVDWDLIWSQYHHQYPVWFSLTKTKMVKNEKITNLLTKTKTETKNDETNTKLKRENRKRFKTETKKLKTKTKMPKQQNLSLNESTSIQYSAYGCYSRTAWNPWLTVGGI